MDRKIVIFVLGNRNAGKSTTWNELFGYTVRTGSNLRRLYLTAKEYVEVFLVSGSPEERNVYVGDLVGRHRPRIVLCSIQYRDDVIDTLKYFSQHNYGMYTQWLNPGFSDPGPQGDRIRLVPYLLDRGSIVGIRNAKTTPAQRVAEIRDFLYGWARSRRLILV